MIVCSCNVFTDRDVRECLTKPCAPERARDVYTALGCTPKCGCCARTITDIIQDVRGTDLTAEADELPPEVVTAA